ncbi:hypothetical protein SAMN05216315_1219 [Nitrosospira sp. Nsp18]|uniref:DUF799 domain-containing protein n=1 Tax=Nitrosospira sp. Nsp18 TaxID=1855334 RepID=UPI00088358F9|nr:GNA1162 family protein [Nitrosospira sp. Nsp18]SDA23559.1 hypothetical protein SAMN05216315_1219 [Nitrosospira sp. Nsp18]
MKSILAIAACVALNLLSGCAVQPEKIDLSAFHTYKPRSIVIVPVLNETTEISAPSVFVSTITRPLAERGYYVFPVYLTDLVLRDFGLAEAGHIHQLDTQRLFELFGADAALFITIKDWSSKYIVLASTVVVEMDYELKDTKTGTVLWRSKQQVAQSSGGDDLISMAVSAAITAMLADYLPLARQANNQAFIPPRGLPAGPYNADYGRDQDKF